MLSRWCILSLFALVAISCWLFEMNPSCSRPLPQSVSSLLAEMGAVLELHSSSAVVEAAARTFLSLCGEETAGCSVAWAARDSLVQRWVDQLTALLGDSLEVRGTDRLYVYPFWGHRILPIPKTFLFLAFYCMKYCVLSLLRTSENPSN